ncbi:hypothetical protein [Hymenobacter sp. BRD67]|nr:hypothetical protein [Hymenobacter sp. BRD67]
MKRLLYFLLTFLLGQARAWLRPSWHPSTPPAGATTGQFFRM